MSDAEKLAKIIEKNPGAVALVDNDDWYLEAPKPAGYDEWDEEQRYYWDEHRSTLARSYDFPELGATYGRGLLEAMALLTNITIENA